MQSVPHSRISKSKVAHDGCDSLKPRLDSEFFVREELVPERAKNGSGVSFPDQHAEKLVDVPVSERYTHPRPEVSKPIASVVHCLQTNQHYSLFAIQSARPS